MMISVILAESKRAQEDRIGKGKETRKDARDPLRRHKRSNCYSNILIKEFMENLALIDSFSEFKDDKLIDRNAYGNFGRCI
jgi:hypothetical protein